MYSKNKKTFLTNDCCFTAKFERPVCLNLCEYDIDKRDQAEKDNA